MKDTNGKSLGCTHCDDAAQMEKCRKCPLYVVDGTKKFKCSCSCEDKAV
jgi:hypothetical protein